MGASKLEQPIALGQQERVIAAGIARLIAAFELHREHPIVGKKHDCAVFALASQTGLMYERMLIGGYKNSAQVRIVKMQKVALNEVESVAAGTILLSTARIPGGQHFFVRASVDETAAPTLYASKLGTGGDIALSTFPQIQMLYPVKNTFVVSELILQESGR